MKLKLLMGIISMIGASFVQGQTYYAPRSTNTDSFVCVDQYNNPIPGASWIAGPVTYLYTNGHFHGDPFLGQVQPPLSSIFPSAGTSDANGVITVNVSTTLVGQIESVYLQCTYGGVTISGNFDYGVGYTDLQFASSPSWIQVGGNNTGHGDNNYNHYLQGNAINGLAGATQTYLSNHPGQTQICTNDMALPIGGKFDIYAIVPSRAGVLSPWTQPHIAHDRGTAIDVAGPGSGSCPANQVDINEFVQACIANGANSMNSLSEGDHAHCNFASVATYPH